MSPSRFTFRSVGRAALLAVGLSLALGVGAGCRRPAGQQIVLTKDQEQQIAANVLTAPPAGMQAKADTKFEDKVVLLGYDIVGKPKKGGNFDLVMYFRVDQPVAGDWKVFVHFEAPGKRRQPFDHYGVNGLYPVGQWKKGEIIKDVVSIAVPGDWAENDAQLLIGFFDWGLYNSTQGDRRLKVESPGSLSVDKDGRVLLTTVTLEGGAAPGGAAAEPTPSGRGVLDLGDTLKEVQVSKVAQAPALDGKDDDAAWQGALPILIARQPDGRPLDRAINASAKVAWDDDHLYVFARASDGDVRNPNQGNDSTLWEGDVIELFLRAPGQDGKYIELQWAPNGSRFDALFTAPRTPKWEEAAKHETGMEYKVVVDGDVNADGADRGFAVEAKIPWKGLGLTGAPADGSVFDANFYRIDDKGTHDIAHMGAWVPMGGDFHKLDGAGKLKFVAAAPAPAAKPEAPAGAAK